MTTLKSITIHIFIFYFQSSAHATTPTPDERIIESEQSTHWERQLNGSKILNPQERIERLALGLRNIGYRTDTPGHSIQTLDLYHKIQNEIISIPGHAHYLKEKVTQEQNKVKSLEFYTMERNAYDANRIKYINEILVRLPSPETVLVLGEFLSDEKDVPPPPRPNQDWAPSPTNAKISVSSLSNIGLRNAPSPPHVSMYDQDSKYLISYREWYEKIKTGTLPFSFIGQTVEYRFKPDGTVESTPLPGSVLEQDPKPPVPAPAAPVTRPHGDVPEARKSSPDASVWSLIAGGILALAAVFYWLRSRRTGRPE